MKYELVIPGNPVGKARPFFTKNGHGFTPEKTANFENLVRLKFMEKYPDAKPLETAVRAGIVAEFPIPKTSKAKRAAMLAGTIKPEKKPDCDNIAKICLDALNGYAYDDDKRVTFLAVEKTYSETPRTKIVITDAGEMA